MRKKNFNNKTAFAIIFVYIFLFISINCMVRNLKKPRLGSKLSNIPQELNNLGDCDYCLVKNETIAQTICHNCHEELPLRIHRGSVYHKDKKEDCAACHSISNIFFTEKSEKYYLKNTRCSICHMDSHNGYEPKCVECHNKQDWVVDIW